jgi:hypothetical protein
MYARVVYLATFAQNCYEDTLIATREGLNIAPDILQHLDMDHRLHDALHLREIPADDVTLKPSLLQK